MDFIHEFTWAWRVLRNDESVRSFGGIWEILGRVPAACAYKCNSISDPRNDGIIIIYLFNGTLNNGVNNKVRFGNFDILL